MKRISILAISSLSLVLLAACGGVTGEVASTQPTGTNAAPSSAPTSTPDVAVTEPSETPTPTPTDDGTVKFDKAYTWENGLSATVSAPKAYKPSDTASADGSFKYFVVFTVTLVNKTGKPFDPSMTQESVQSADVEGGQVFDSAKGIDGSLDTKILNGRQGKYRVVFGVANPKDVVFELTPSFEYDSTIFTK
jgi:hypothetical protein